MSLSFFRPLLLLFLVPTSLFGSCCDPYTYCCRTPKYVIASSVILGAVAGAGAGYAAGHDRCCRRKPHCDGKVSSPLLFSEVPLSLNLAPPSDETELGPEIIVTIYRPDGHVYFIGSMGRTILPEVPNLGGQGNPTETGNWTVSFQVMDVGTSLLSDFGGIAINGQVLRTLVVDPLRAGEQQQILFTYPL